MPKTIYDIAKEANVSIATVSRVFNNSGSVRESTREKILQIADDLGYHPHAYAQGLASKRKNYIMMLVPVMSNYFFTEILKGAQGVLANYDIELSIVNIKQDQDSLEQVEQILKRKWADGYLLASLHLSEDDLKKLERFNVPISLLDDYSPCFDSVSFNNEEGGYMAAGYLLKKGFQRIALISGKSDSIPLTYRVSGYRRALAEFNVPFDPNLIISGKSMDRDGFTERAGYEAMQKVLNLDPVPDAVFCSSDIKALGALKAMDDRNRHLPIVSYDNLSISEYVGLSTIHQPMYDMGFQATKNLLERIHEPDKEDICNQIHGPELIIRPSSEV